jgi:hypothetical protein
VACENAHREQASYWASEGGTGEEVDAMVRETLQLPRPVLDRIGEMMR